METTPEVLPDPEMPAPVANAIGNVMADIRKISKDNTNKHGGYAFTSIDDFLEALRPLCSEHGLIILQEEQSVDTLGSGETTWLKVMYEFRIAHDSGVMYARPMHRTAMANLKMGPQAMGATQSYAFKNFARSLFQIATGDVDIDDDSAHTHDRMPVREQKPGGSVRAAGSNGLAKDSKLPPMWKGPLSPDELTERMRVLRDDLPAMGEADLLIPALNHNQAAFDQCAIDLPKIWEQIEPLIDKQKEIVGV